MIQGAVDSRRRAIGWTGIGRYVAALHRHLPGVLGVNSPVFLSGGGLQVAQDGIPKSRHVTSRIQKVLWEQVALPAWLARNQPSFLHLPWYEGPWTPRCPLIVTIYDLDTLIHPTRYSVLFRAYYNELLLRYARVATRILVSSETTARDVDEHLLAGQKTLVTPLGIDPEFRSPDTARGRALLTDLGVSRDQPVLVTAAGTGIRKNIPILATALRMLAASGLPVTLVVTQTSTIPPSLRPASEGLHVVAAGRLSTADLAALYAVANVSVCPSLYEGFGFAVVESMAAGCAVICSNSGSHPEIAGGAAILFDPRNAGELAADIRSVLEDPSLTTNLKLRGHERAKTFDWRTTIERTAAAYRAA